MPSPHGSEATSASLLRQLQSSAPGAWVRFEKVYRRLIDYWCQEGGLPARDWPDMYQDILVKLHGAVGTFHSDRGQGSFRGWLYRITRNRIVDYHRDRKARREVPLTQDVADRLARLDADEESPKPTSARLLLENALQLVHGDFAEKTWQAFALHGLEGLPAPEVASRLGMTALAVRQAKARVLRRLRAEFGELP